MLFSEAIEGFRFYQGVCNHSPATLEWYSKRLTPLDKFLCSKSPKPQIEQVTKQDVMEFISSLQNRQTVWGSDKYHKPQQKKLSAFTIHGYARCLATFFKWTQREGFTETNPMENIPKPKVPHSFKERFSEDEIKRLLDSARKCDKRTATRNIALICFLLDTAARASEVCGLTPQDFDPNLQRCKVTGKGMRDRYLVLGSKTKMALWHYLKTRPEPKAGNFVFLTAKGCPLDANKLNHILTQLGKKAGVTPCGTHRFRHTAARLFVRNGADAFTLQTMLGHASITTSAIYARMEIGDLQEMHKRASPIDRLPF